MANCYYRAEGSIEPKPLPALIAPVTDLNGRTTGVHRTWLRADGGGKADLPEPRKALGELRGHGVRFGIPSVVLAAGEGIETMLVNRLAKGTPDRRAKRTPGSILLFGSASAILPSRPMRLLSRRAQRRSRTAALPAAARKGLFLRAVSTAA